jgi:hypothetical protein
LQRHFNREEEARNRQWLRVPGACICHCWRPTA